MGVQLEPIGVEGQDYNIVEKNGRRIVVPIRKDGEKYHNDPQIRAFQMVQEGRFGGPGRGQGRKPVMPRAAQKVADEIRKRADKIVAALDAGLAADSVQTRLKAAGMALEIEREETLLRLKEEQQEAELDGMSKEELVATFIQLVSDPAAEAAIGVIELPETEVEDITTEVSTGDSATDEGQAPQPVATSASPAPPRTRLRAFGGNGRGAAPRPGAPDAGSTPEAA